MLRLREIRPIDTRIEDAAAGQKGVPSSMVMLEYEFDCGVIRSSVQVGLRDTDEEMITVARKETLQAMRDLLDRTSVE